jgi:hypothetical protein
VKLQVLSSPISSKPQLLKFETMSDFSIVLSADLIQKNYCARIEAIKKGI